MGGVLTKKNDDYELVNMGAGSCYQRAAVGGVCCAGWWGRSLPGSRRIASGFVAMCLTGRALGVAWRDIIRSGGGG